MRYTLIILYLITALILVFFLVQGGTYYSLPLSERPHSASHPSLKPSGFIGHGAGVIGSVLMLILLLYSVRKRMRSAHRWGNIQIWLNIHIWMGITGPLLVIFHTAFKFNGIVAISFWSMIAVALSGVLGRYIYLQIPRDIRGEELSDQDLRDLDDGLIRQIAGLLKMEESAQQKFMGFAEGQIQMPAKGLRSLWRWMLQDISQPFRVHRLKMGLRTRPGYSTTEIKRILKLVQQRTKLRRRTIFLSTAKSLLHQWHIIHKPFAVVMLAIMVVHVIVTVALGYHWILG